MKGMLNYVVFYNPPGNLSRMGEKEGSLFGLCLFLQLLVLINEK